MLENALKLKIPPLLLTVIFFILMWCLSLLTPSFHGFLFIRAIGSACLFVAGLLICAAGILSFKMAKTTVNPMHPESSSELITYGVYTISRNPMYVGFLSILLGWFFQLGNLFSLVFPIIFFFYINHFQIEPEEKALQLLFKDEYKKYKNSVRRWL